MPLYDYKCRKHGVFSELVAMQDHDKPQPCPQCQAVSARVIILPPEFALLDKKVRDAIERNEKASHEPEAMTTGQFHEREQERMARHHHDKKGCSCGHNDQKRVRNLVYTAEGDKMFPFMRPWMISH